RLPLVPPGRRLGSASPHGRPRRGRGDGRGPARRGPRPAPGRHRGPAPPRPRRPRGGARALGPPARHRARGGHRPGPPAPPPRLADNQPSFERVLATEPDFVASSFTSTLSKGGVASREKFEELGVPTYLSPADCEGKDNSGDGDGSRTKPLTMETVYREVREL